MPKHYPLHAACKLFPPIGKVELQELAEDIGRLRSGRRRRERAHTDDDRIPTGSNQVRQRNRGQELTG